METITIPGLWAGAECTDCGVQPDKSRAFKGTWRVATYHPEYGSISIIFSFKGECCLDSREAIDRPNNMVGIAIYMYFIIPNFALADGVTTEAACEFILDGQMVEIFNRTPTSSHDFEYNVLFYSNTRL